MKSIVRLYLPGVKPGDETILSRAENHRLTQVLRLKPQASFQVFDGAGNEYHARLESDRGRASARIGALIRREAEPRLTVALVPSISRATRMEWMLEKAVELGAAAIHPVLAERGKVRLDPTRAERRMTHWRAVIVSAATQCGRARLPPVATPVPLAEALREVRAHRRVALLPDAEAPLASMDAPEGSLALLSGPESGFSAGETAQIQAAGWQTARLAPFTLRAETAGPAALAAAQALWGDWRS